MKEITRATVLDALRRHIGRVNGVTARRLVQEITDDMLPNAGAERALREVIVELRLEGQHIGAHPASGYYICANADELNEACLFLLERVATGARQIAAMKKVSEPDLKGQLHLPT